MMKKSICRILKIFFICMIFARYERNYECDNVYMYEILFLYILSFWEFPLFICTYIDTCVYIYIFVYYLYIYYFTKYDL